jgi:purine-binding chemotaxis protein CheW
MPPILAREGNLSDIGEICRLEGGKRLVSILSVSNMFRHAAISEALTTVDNMNSGTSAAIETSSEERRSDDEEQVVVFRLGKEEFGVPIDSVQEIVRVSEELTRVPKAPPSVEGVINLRGAVLPVVDLRRRLGLEHVERSDRQRIIVLLIAGVRTGFIVDSVAEVLKVPKSTIEASPRLSTEQTLLLARMANLEKQKRMVQLIEPIHLLDKQHLNDIAGLAA